LLTNRHFLAERADLCFAFSEASKELIAGSGSCAFPAEASQAIENAHSAGDNSSK
jgi:hypothetical protein